MFTDKAYDKNLFGERTDAIDINNLVIASKIIKDS